MFELLRCEGGKDSKNLKEGTHNVGRIFGEAEPLLYTMFLELEAILKRCGLVEHEVVWSCIRILEEVSYALELNRDA